MTAKAKKAPKKSDVAIAMAASGIELALYITVPIGAGYLIGRYFGDVGAVAGLFIGALSGLALAVRRAVKMTL